MPEKDLAYEITKQNYEKGADWHSEKFADYSWAEQIDRFHQALPGDKVLDAGCGSGRDVQAFLEKGLTAEGLDYSSESIRRCREKFKRALFHEGDLKELKFEDASYDGVWACASILNLKKEDAASALREFHRILKAQGVLFVSVKKGEGEKMVPDKAGERFFSFFSAPEIRGMIEAAGFEVFHEEIVADSDLTGNPAHKERPDWICVFARTV